MFTASSKSDLIICPWQPMDGVPELGPGTVHLWWVSLGAGQDLVTRLRSVLSSRERERADRYRFERHSDAFTVGRSMLRLLLHGYTGVEPEAIGFDYGPRGKPGLAPEPAVECLHFNYSDAGGKALYAFARNAELGVDIEDLNREVSFERILRRKFTEQEVKANLALPDERRRQAFLTCWTRKEGYGKAKGWGIYYPLDSVETCVDCDSDRLELIEEGDEAESWIIRQLYPNDHFVGSLVYPAEIDRQGEVDIRYMCTEPSRWLSL